MSIFYVLINKESNIKKKALNLLQKYWGYSEFRPDQLEVIENVCEGNDTLVLFPTGGGKSICFQIPALIFPHTSIVITPLIALMEDQVQRLKKQNISAEAIHSGKSPKEIDTIIENCKWGDTRLLYISPERLSQPNFQERLSMVKVSSIVMDEAHCISQWGHDFRPSYVQIGEISNRIWPNAVNVAFTATATKKVVNDIVKYGGLRNNKVFRKSFQRKNIALHVIKTDRKHESLKKLVKSLKEKNLIVYVRSRKEVKNLSILLNGAGIKSTYYHAGLSMGERAKVQSNYMNNEVDAICATNAFGMGLDKADVRQVIHFDVPPSLEEYTQEFGRAGRDGEMSSAYMIINEGDVTYMQQKSIERFPTFEVIKQVYIDLHNYLRIPVGEGEGRVVDYDIYKFGFFSKQKTKLIYYAIEILKKNEYLESYQKFNSATKLRVLCSIHQVRENTLSENTKALLMALVRVYEGILEYEVEINTVMLSTFCELDQDEIEQSLLDLQSIGWINYRKDKEGQKLVLLRDRLPQNLFHIDLSQYRSQQKHALEMMNAVSDYINTEKCRSLTITDYFDENIKEPCGICDICIPPKENDSSIQSKMEEGLL